MSSGSQKPTQKKSTLLQKDIVFATKASYEKAKCENKRVWRSLTDREGLPVNKEVRIEIRCSGEWMRRILGGDPAVSWLLLPWQRTKSPQTFAAFFWSSRLLQLQTTSVKDREELAISEGLIYHQSEVQKHAVERCKGSLAMELKCSQICSRCAFGIATKRCDAAWLPVCRLMKLNGSHENNWDDCSSCLCMLFLKTHNAMLTAACKSTKNRLEICLFLPLQARYGTADRGVRLYSSLPMRPNPDGKRLPSTGVRLVSHSLPSSPMPPPPINLIHLHIKCLQRTSEVNFVGPGRLPNSIWGSNDWHPKWLN